MRDARMFLLMIVTTIGLGACAPATSESAALDHAVLRHAGPTGFDVECSHAICQR